MTDQKAAARPIGPDSDLEQVFELAQQLRVDSVRASTAAARATPPPACPPPT